jgi:hypothetical protein
MPDIPHAPRRLARRYASVVLDCDSTLCTIEGVEELARAHRAEVERLTEAAMRGEVPLEQVYAHRLDLVRPTRAALAALGERDPAKHSLMNRHLVYWRDKWGFDPVNPDVDSILERYAGSEVCWRFEPERRAAGERIAAAYRSPVTR